MKGEELAEKSLPTAVRAQGDNLLACIHCGFCLPHCPTYGVIGDENDSPRGRLYLMRAVAEGRLDPDPAYTRHIESCIVCRACESACPSGVRFGAIMEAARSDLRTLSASDMGLFARVARWVGLHVLMPNRWLLKPAVVPMRLIRYLRPQNGWWKWLPGVVRLGLEMLPPPPAKRPRFATAIGKERGPVIQFRGCVMDELYMNVNLATTRVLTVNGFDVKKPSRQTCCGSLHDHAGFVDAARELARRNVDALEDGSDVPIVVNAAGCGALMKEYGELLEHDPAYAERAHRFAKRVRDITELLAEGNVVPGAPVPHHITYDAPCHLHHAQKLHNAPIAVLKAIPNLHFTALRGAERCCASGGIYNLTHPEIATEVLAEKLEAIGETEADAIVTVNPGCQMQIQAGARIAGLTLSVSHIVELLDESYDNAGYYQGSDGNGRKE